MSVTEHGSIPKTWAEADTTRESHEDLDALPASPIPISNQTGRIAPNLPHNRPWTATSTLDLTPVQIRQVTRLRRADLSGFCIGLRLDRRGCSFPQPAAEIRSDRQGLAVFCKVSTIGLHISAGES